MPAAEAADALPPTKTLIVVILDESGSIEKEKRNVIGDYNGFIHAQKKVENDKGRLVLVNFDLKTTVIHFATPLTNRLFLPEIRYRPIRSTALDAVAYGIKFAEEVVQIDERVIVLIMTYGEENSSNISTAEEVMAMIAVKENLGNWTVSCIGENSDGWAKALGQSDRVAPNVKRYDATRQKSNFEEASEAVERHRKIRKSQVKEGFW